MSVFRLQEQLQLFDDEDALIHDDLWRCLYLLEASIRILVLAYTKQFSSKKKEKKNSWKKMDQIMWESSLMGKSNLI